MKEKKNSTGIILAGGLSTRMNGTDKGLLTINGKPIIEILIGILKPVTDELIIIANNGSYNYLGLKVCNDLKKDIGPMGGIYTGLTHSSSEINIVVACDMPGITRPFLNFLIREFQSGNYEAIVPAYKRELQPMSAAYNKSILPLVNEFIEKKKYSMKDVIRNCQHKIITIEDHPEFLGEDLFRNVNTEKDYKLLSENKNEK